MPIIKHPRITHHAWADPKQDKESPKRKEIGAIIGRATAVKQAKVALTGDILKGMIGQFEATNADTGEVSIGEVCYLPAGFQEAGIKKLEDNPGSVIEFAFRVFSVPSNNPQGYSYAMEPLLEAKETDDLAPLRKLLEHRRPQRIRRNEVIEGEASETATETDAAA